MVTVVNTSTGHCKITRNIAIMVTLNLRKKDYYKVTIHVTEMDSISPKGPKYLYSRM